MRELPPPHHHINYFIDNNLAKQGTSFLGGKVVSLEHFLSQPTKQPKLILISSVNTVTCTQIKKQLTSYNVDFLTIDEYVFSKRIEEILQVLELLDDDFSKCVYTEMVIARMSSQPFPENLYSRDQYFCMSPFRDTNPNEIFVDLGAYVGDTLEQYIQTKYGIFSKIFTFEPELRNMEALQYRVDRLHKEWAFPKERITCIKAGIGRHSEKLSLSNTNTESPSLAANFIDTNNSGIGQIQIFSIDDYFADQKVSFIKADIEGYEFDMLQGAEKTILRDQPLLAISIYHNATDMWRIPLWLSKTLPNYTFKIRQHSHLSMDTILYAYPQ